MDTSALKEILRHAADMQPAPSPHAETAIQRRANRRRKRRHISWAAAAVVASGGLSGTIITVAAHNGRNETVTVTAPTDAPATLRIGPVGMAELRAYAQSDGQISGVTSVVMKQTTWANYVIWALRTPGMPTSAGYSGSEGHIESPIFTSSDPVYVIVQTGASDCATSACQSHRYHWAVNVIEVGGRIDGGMITSSPGTANPAPDIASLAGPQAQLNTLTGQVTSVASPPLPAPTLPVPSVVGQSPDLAASELQNLGFSSLGPDHTGIIMQPPKTARVTSQDPAAGSLAPAGSTIILTTSS
jgi:hypothetical protein